MKKQFDLIIFDWDGTLVDSIDWIVRCLQNAARECGRNAPEAQAAREIIGLSIERAMAELFPGIDARTQEQLIRVYSQQFFSKKIGRDDLFDGVYQMLEQFKRAGYRLAVATGKKNAGLMDAMSATGVIDFFDTTRSADQTASKPHPLMIDQIIEEMNVGKDRVVMVGDSVHDLQMASNAGVAAIAVECGAHRAEVLKQYDPLLCLPQTRALLDLI
ncbi:HAD-IIIA family hydrolase [Methylomarinum sp. Ch1-1]|uniref:HAD-IIIA family hydrolase n=1 Tax=Methylomarinum roseum TaxID=3067653 RepID=A0AAU7NPS7_9GAMM|nr:HAD-IIIA family hydrolase [Methylomarinum sp. Ch1-1]MDP4521106.1 HAD-IIIA family hydrolase [Methylomarinum sp. Ch1-1]